jgi:hypothetical protein
MQVFEIAGYKSGIDRAGVNFLSPSDSFQNIQNGFIYRQVLQSRKGFRQFSTARLSDGNRVMGIFTNYLRSGLKETLVFTTENLYRYNVGTDTFDLIPLGATAAPWVINNPAHYVTGTTYPFPDGSDRFVFTSQGMNDIYQFDSGTVNSYTNVISNPQYQAPSQGAINNAKHILYFGERLNFVYPQLGGNFYPQGFLFSAIRSADGGGEKYSGAGSAGAGLIILDTGAFISGASILGNTICLNVSDSNWILEKTEDAFNPYFPRKIPSVIGTNADYSFSQWGNQVMSMGNTGIVITDGRVSNRADDKIPFFTKDDIDNEYFQLTYGGFDRITSQFLFSYLSDQELFGTTSQNKVLTANYEEKTWSVYDMRFSVFGETDAGTELPWDEIYEANDPTWIAWDSTEDIWDSIGIEKSTYKTLAGDNDGFVWQMDVDYDDYVGEITGITPGATTVITISNPTPFRAGDRVSIEAVQGMTQINNFNPDTDQVKPAPPYTVTAVNAAFTEITIDVDSTQFDAYTTGGLISKVIEFSAETIPFNPWRAEGRKCFVSFIEILIDVGTLGEVLLDVYSDEDEAPFMQDVPLKPQNTQSQREWVSMSINMESNFLTFAMKQTSPGSQVKITSFRIHAAPGALTSY